MAIRDPAPRRAREREAVGYRPYTNRTNVTSSTHNLGCTHLVDVSLDRPEIAVPDDLSVPFLSPHERGGGPADRDGPGNQSLESGTEHQAARFPRRREMSCDWLNQLVQEHEAEMAKYNVKFEIRTSNHNRRALAGTHSGCRSTTAPRPAGRRRACSFPGWEALRWTVAPLVRCTQRMTEFNRFTGFSTESGPEHRGKSLYLSDEPRSSCPPNTGSSSIWIAPFSSQEACSPFSPSG